MLHKNPLIAFKRLSRLYGGIALIVASSHLVRLSPWFGLVFAAGMLLMLSVIRPVMRETYRGLNLPRPKTPVKVKLPTSAEMATQMKHEILADIAAGRVPAGVRDFSHLHDFVDANCYGGTEALWDALSEGIADDDDEAQCDVRDALFAVMTPAQNTVNAWLIAGRIDGNDKG